MFEKYECCMDQSISINCIFGPWPSYEKYILLMLSPLAFFLSTLEFIRRISSLLENKLQVQRSSESGSAF